MSNLLETIILQCAGPHCKPVVQPNGDWIDLALEHEEVLHAGHSKKLSLGVAMKLPKGYEAHIIPRSSTFSRYGIILVNSMGLIDNSYCGPQDIWTFHAFAMVDITIPAGTRICQFRITEKQPKIIFDIVPRLHGDNRGGYGSTGV